MRARSLLREDAQVIFRFAFETIRRELLTGNQVSIPKFGTFYLKVSKAREWTQPSSQEEILIPPKVRLRFRPTRFFEKQLQKALNPQEIHDEPSFDEAEEEI
jgi:nucleoid DNA-binding protein